MTSHSFDSRTYRVAGSFFLDHQSHIRALPKPA